MPDSWKCRGRILLAQARNLFLSGLIALLPVIVTIYVVFWLAIRLDSVLKRILPEQLGFPGIGILMAIVLVFLIGLWTKLWIGRKFLHMTQSILGRIPLVRAIYGAARDLVGLFSKGGAQQFNQVVMIEPPGLGFKMLGFVTRTDLSDLPPEVADQGRVAVYLPLAYQMGGFTVLIDKAHIRPVDMPLQSAIKFVITAGVAKEIHEQPIDVKEDLTRGMRVPKSDGPCDEQKP